MNHRVFDFSHFPTIETERLQLREMTPADVTALLKHLGNPEVVRFMDMQPITTREQADQWLQWMGSFFSARDGMRWGIALKDTAELIGSVGIHGWNREARYAEVGYDIARQYWDNGYATEVLKAIVEFGFLRMNLNRVEADVVDGNTASMRVLEKIGFLHEGVLRERSYKGGQYYDIHLFSLLRKDFLTDGT